MRKLLLMLLSVPLFFGIYQQSASAYHHCVVQKGDSMWSIALRYKVPFAEVLRLNQHFANPHMIHPLDKILLPDGSTGSQTSTDSEYDDISPDDQSEKEAKKALEDMGIIPLAETQAETLIKGILVNAVPRGYKIEIRG